MKKGSGWALGFCFGVASQLIARGANASLEKVLFVKTQFLQ
ncbi:hypothetical protein ACV2XM_001448 [Campylobacter upsaliensis]